MITIILSLFSFIVNKNKTIIKIEPFEETTVTIAIEQDEVGYLKVNLESVKDKNIYIFDLENQY